MGARCVLRYRELLLGASQSDATAAHIGFRTGWMLVAKRAIPRDAILAGGRTVCCRSDETRSLAPMTLPSDGPGILTYLALIVPGLIFIAIRAQLRGFRDVDRSVGARILLAFVVSAILDAIYLAFLGGPVLERLQTGRSISSGELTAAAWLFLLLGILIPVLMSWAIYGDAPILRPLHRGFARAGASLTDSRYESTPTAWDLVATSTDAGWVRVRLGDGVWVGGRFGNNSYFSTYPEPRDLFIEEQYAMTEDGGFQDPLPSSAGVWLAIKDDYQVEWLHDSEE